MLMKMIHANFTDGVEILCGAVHEIPREILGQCSILHAKSFADQGRWLSTYQGKKAFTSEVCWAVAVRDGRVGASLYIEQNLSDGGKIGIIKAVVSDGTIPGIAKLLIASGTREVTRSTDIPVQYEAYLRVINGEPNIPSAKAFNKMGFVQRRVERHLIEMEESHLLIDEIIKDGRIDVQPFIGTASDVQEHSDWLLRDWRNS